MLAYERLERRNREFGCTEEDQSHWEGLAREEITLRRDEFLTLNLKGPRR